MSFRVGIVGCGGIARLHAEGYVKNEANIVGLTDCNPEAANKLAEQFKADKFPNYQALIQETHPDVISICTPPVFHAEAAVYALGLGVHVLCEKPMAYDLKSAYRMRDAVRKSAAMLMPAFPHRFRPAIIALRDLIASGKLGDSVFFNNVFCGPLFGMEDRWFTKKAIAGGGSILDTNSHSVDIFRFLIGEIADQKIVMHRHFRNTNVEDAGVLSVKAENGALGSMESAFVAGVSVMYIDIIGTKGRAVYDYETSDELKYKLLGESDWVVEKVDPASGFAEEIAHFLGAIRGNHPLSCTVDDGVRAIEVIFNAYPDA